MNTQITLEIYNDEEICTSLNDKFLSNINIDIAGITYSIEGRDYVLEQFGEFYTQFHLKRVV